MKFIQLVIALHYSTDLRLETITFQQTRSKVEEKSVAKGLSSTMDKICIVILRITFFTKQKLHTNLTWCLV